VSGVRGNDLNCPSNSHPDVMCPCR
jgi:hypothetical protein